METVKGALDSAKQAMGLSGAPEQGTTAGEQTVGAAHKTAAVPQTGTHVVSSLEEAGHRMQEQRGPDNPGFYKAQEKLTEALHRGNEKLGES